MGSEGEGSYGGGAAAAAAPCDACGGAAAASVYCAADAAALCAACDADIHAANPLASRHERVPLPAAAVSFFAGDEEGSASSWLNESSNSSCQSSNTEKSLVEFFSDMDAYLELIGGGGQAHLSDSVVPTTGALWPRPHHLYTGHSISWSPEAGVVPAAAAAVSVSSAVAAAEREARVRRYREKRKNRRFQKTIRYASRKAYAEARPRIKGRFVKGGGGGAPPEEAAKAKAQAGGGVADAAEAGDDKFWFSFPASAANNGGGFYIDPAYGIVPSF